MEITLPFEAFSNGNVFVRNNEKGFLWKNILPFFPPFAIKWLHKLAFNILYIRLLLARKQTKGSTLNPKKYETATKLAPLGAGRSGLNPTHFHPKIDLSMKAFKKVWSTPWRQDTHSQTSIHLSMWNVCHGLYHVGQPIGPPWMAPHMTHALASTCAYIIQIPHGPIYT